MNRKESTTEFGGASPYEQGKAFEMQRYVKEAPFFKDSIHDVSRTSTFRYWKGISSTRDNQVKSIIPTDSQETEITEHEGLVQLGQFLQDAIERLGAQLDPKCAELALQAKYIQDNLRYIGNKELEEAAMGIASLWKFYLDKNPRLRLCIPMGIVRAQINDSRKSSEYLFDRIMRYFSDEEIKRYKGRIFTDLNKVKRMRNTKIILLDDWSISGTQLSNGFAQVFDKFGSADNIEAHLVAASQQQIDTPKIQGRVIPHFAYFRLSSGFTQKEPLITGTHSSVDFDFEDPIKQMVDALNTLDPENPVSMPPCTNIIRPYNQ